ADAGHHVFALDWRGHGDSEWVGSGGYYHFADYAADLAFLVRALGGRAVLVGHSMGATAAMSYTGLEPERVPALLLVDALAAPASGSEPARPRHEAWPGAPARRGDRRHRTLTLEQATSRLHERVYHFSLEVARHMAEHGTRVSNGGRQWKFDPLHQTTSPVPFSRARAAGFWRRVAAPVLYLHGGEGPPRLAPSRRDRR